MSWPPAGADCAGLPPPGADIEITTADSVVRVGLAPWPCLSY